MNFAETSVCLGSTCDEEVKSRGNCRFYFGGEQQKSNFVLVDNVYTVPVLS